MNEIEEIQIADKKPLSETRPMIIKWKGESMIRNQSLRAAVKEILQVLKNTEVVKIGIIGDQGTGKTTLEDTLGHLIHKMSVQQGGPNFAVRKFGKEEFLKMEDTFKQLEPSTNYVLKFQDLSFLKAVASTKQIELVKQISTVIRHLGKDVKIILIYDYHYTLGLDKYLRQADFRFFTSIGSSEEDNVLKIVGTKYYHRMMQFKKLCVQMKTKNKASFELKKNSFFDYNYKNPFVVSLFWNESRLRYVVFPKREWIDRICPVCTLNEDLQEEVSIPDFFAKAHKSFNPRMIEAALKVKAYTNGVNVYKKTMAQAIKWIDRELQANQIPLLKILTFLGMEESRTKLRIKQEPEPLKEADDPIEGENEDRFC